MLKSELIEILEIENPHLSLTEVERVVAIVFESITQTLEKGARVELRGFGTFSPRYRKARAGRNPRSGEVVAVPEKYVPFFRAGKEIREKIDNTLKD
ncbi:MAG: integration host factor subunit beta [Robiginitomaculum sp.]|nr:MAG: integration host factor subunit beta [Robiginitomaculum sp.]